MDGVFFETAGLFVVLAVRGAISCLPLFLIVGVITLTGRRWLSARTRFALWTLVLVRLLLPFSLETPFGWGNLTNRLTVSTPVAGPAFAEDEFPIPTFEAPLEEIPAGVLVDGSSRVSWTEVGVLTLVFGGTGISLLLATWMLVTSIRTSRRIRRGVDPDHRSWKDLLDQGRRQFGIRMPVQLRCVTNWTTPATMGFFRPIIVLPEDAATLSETELQHVLWHELAHIKRGDAAWSYLWIVARCLQWWNPCFWWTQHCWLAERELACDALVMQHLGSSAAPDYGRTLIHFLERLSSSAGASQRIPLPGLVMLLGDKGIIRRRLKALAGPLAKETVWGRGSGRAILTLLAVMGLTDAAISKTVMPPLNSVTVPEGTVWQFGSDVAADSGIMTLPTTTRVYDVSATVARIRQDEPGLSAEQGAEGLRRDFQCNGNIFPWIEGKPQAGQCQLQGNELTVTATEWQHQQIQHLLDHWQQFGQQQISMRVQQVSTDMQLSGFLPAAGGRIISPVPLREMNLLAPLKLTRDGDSSTLEPSFVRVLSPDELKTVTNRCQNDPPTNLLFARTVTLFTGSSATVSFAKERPFVTGLRTLESGGRQTQVSQVPEGVQLGVVTHVADSTGAVQLGLHIRQSEIVDVEVLRTKMGHEAGELNIQVPHVRESNFKTSVTLAKGESILVAPLRRDKQGKLHMYLISANVIELP